MQPDRVRLWPYVGWWEALLVSLPVIFPAMVLTDGRPLWQRLLAVATAGVVGHVLTSALNQRRRRRAYAEAAREPTQAPGEPRLGMDWRGVGLAILTLTSMIVATGIATAAYRGTLFRASIGWGAITLTFMLSVCWHSLRRPLLNPIWLFVAPLLMLSASLWLKATAG